MAWDDRKRCASDDHDVMARFTRSNISDLAEEHDGEMAAVFASDWRRRRTEEEWKVIRFHAIREQHGPPR